MTYRTFLVGTIAIAGIPPLAGFFSKDEILAATFGAGGAYRLLWVVGLLTAGLTACYMFRAVFMTFEGEFRGNAHERNHLHESPPVMTMPLVVLAVGAAIAGLVGIPEAITFGRRGPQPLPPLPRAVDRRDRTGTRRIATEAAGSSGR